MQRHATIDRGAPRIIGPDPQPPQAITQDLGIRLGHTAKPRLRDAWAILNYRNHPAHHPDHWLKRYTEHPEFWEAALAGIAPRVDAFEALLDELGVGA